MRLMVKWIRMLAPVTSAIPLNETLPAIVTEKPRVFGANGS